MSLIILVSSFFNILVWSPNVTTYFNIKDAVTTVRTVVNFPPTTIATTLHTVITSVVDSGPILYLSKEELRKAINTSMNKTEPYYE